MLWLFDSNGDILTEFSTTISFNFPMRGTF